MWSEIRLSAKVKLLLLLLLPLKIWGQKLGETFFLKLKVNFNSHLLNCNYYLFIFPLYLVVFDKLKVLKMYPHLKAELVESKKTYLYLTYEWNYMFVSNKRNKRKKFYVVVLVTQVVSNFYDPMSMAFSRQEYWSELPFPSPGGLTDPGNEPRSSAL